MSRPRRVWPVARPSRTLLPLHLLREQGSWFYLFHALLALLILYPYLETYAEDKIPWALNLLNALVIVSVVYSVSFNRGQFVLVLFLAIPSILCDWMPQSDPIRLVGIAFTVLLYAYAILMILPFLLHAEEVETEEIYGAAALYLLLGLIWASLFQAVEILYPGSFHIESIHNLDRVFNWSDLLFFSFTTITTLGYGDIVPVTSQARSLAMIEAFTGVIYLAVIISRSIGLYVAQSLEKKRSAQHQKDH
ncbi:MAG: two pore domain potassium channel family protein [Chlamydiia bacterium]|nr:two pore domain potassium channel family protein [Chlamydiia bacterium]